MSIVLEPINPSRENIATSALIVRRFRLWRVCVTISGMRDIFVRRRTDCRLVSAFVFFLFGVVPPYSASAAPPQIWFTSVPSYGTSDLLRGGFSGGSPGSWQIAVVINI